MDQPLSASNKSTFKDLPDEMKPREEFLLHGAANVPNETLLAILLRTGIRHGKKNGDVKNVLELAHETLAHFGGLSNLFQSDFDELVRAQIVGLGRVKCIELAAAFELGRRAVTSQLTAAPGLSIANPQVIFQLIYPRTQHLTQEVVWIILMDVKGHLVGQPMECSRGNLARSPIHPREIFAKAIRCNAAAVIVAHNHPSGDTEPSREDIETTRRLIEAGKLVGVPLFDHVIIGRPINGSPGYTSLRSRNVTGFSEGSFKETPND